MQWGIIEHAFDYVEKEGINNEVTYPYVARDQACKIQGGSFEIANHTYYKGCDEIIEGVSQHPISV